MAGKGSSAASAEPAVVKAAQDQIGRARTGELIETCMARVAEGLVAGGVRRLVEFATEHPAAAVYIRSDALAEEVDSQVSAYQDDTSHPTSGFNGVNLALHVCETLDLYGFGSPREK